MAEVGASEGTIPYYSHFFQEKRKKNEKREKKSDILGTFYVFLSPTGQSQDSVHYFKRVVKEFILVCFVSEILINAYN